VSVFRQFYFFGLQINHAFAVLINDNCVDLNEVSSDLDDVLRVDGGFLDRRRPRLW
jgi:hypothetical protein